MELMSAECSGVLGSIPPHTDSMIGKYWTRKEAWRYKEVESIFLRKRGTAPPMQPCSIPKKTKYKNQTGRTQLMEKSRKTGSMRRSMGEVKKNEGRGAAIAVSFPRFQSTFPSVPQHKHPEPNASFTDPIR